MAASPPSRRRPAAAPNTAALAALGQSAGEVAHDLDNALSAILTHAALLRAELASRPGPPFGPMPTAPDALGHVESIIRSAKIASAIVERVRGRLRPSAEGEGPGVEVASRFGRERVDLEALVDEALVSAQGRARLKDIALARDSAFPPIGPIAGNSAELLQLVLNLVHNAIDASPEGGTVAIATRAQGDAVVLTVDDDGPGIAPALMERLFEPFFTTKGEAGTGLGLPLARTIAEQHGGTLDLTSTPASATHPGGTTATVTLPLASRSSPFTIDSARAATDLELGALGRGYHLLLVDDDPNVRDALALLAEAAGFTVDSAASLEAALDAGARHVPDLIVTDLQLGPSPDPTHLVTTLGLAFPEVPIVVVSGALVAAAPLGQRADGRPLVAATFEKPVSPGKLIAALTALVVGPSKPADPPAEATPRAPRSRGPGGPRAPRGPDVR